MFAIEYAQVLPEDTPFMVESFEPMMGARSAENPVWEAVKAQPSRGAYPGVFDYKYLLDLANVLSQIRRHDPVLESTEISDIGVVDRWATAG